MAGPHTDNSTHLSAADQFVLIVTYGRTGSTLLQGILNAIDGWHIKGENFNFAYHLFESQVALEKAARPERKNNFKSTNPWYGSNSTNFDVLRQDLSRTIRNVLKAGVETQHTTTMGFKEIRYLDTFKQDPGGQLLSEYLDFLRAALEPCKVLFLTRDANDAANSAFWKESETQSLVSTMENFQQFCEGYQRSHCDDCYQIDYRDIVEKTAGLTGMFEFLGAAPEPEVLQQVLLTPHSYDQRKFVAASVPWNSGDPDRPQLLREADRLHAVGKYDQARDLYRQFVESQRLTRQHEIPYYSTIRAGTPAYQVRSVDAGVSGYIPVPGCMRIADSSVAHSSAAQQRRYENLTRQSTTHYSPETFVDNFVFTVLKDPVERFLSIFKHSRTSKVSVSDFAMQLDNMCQKNVCAALAYTPIEFRLMGSLTGITAYPAENFEHLKQDYETRTGSLFPDNISIDPNAADLLKELTESAFEHLLEYYRGDYLLLEDYYTVDRIRQLYAAHRLDRVA